MEFCLASWKAMYWAAPARTLEALKARNTIRVYLQIWLKTSWALSTRYSLAPTLLKTFPKIS